MKSLVVLRAVPDGFEVDVEPPLPDCQDHLRTFFDKGSAWSYAQATWTQHCLGLRDETVNNVVPKSGPRGPYKKRCSL